jgi:alpha-glucosidase
MDLKKIASDISIAGPKLVMQTIASARHRDWLDQVFIDPDTAPSATPIGFLRGSELTARGMKFVFDRASLDVLFLTGDLVCLAWEPGNPPPAYALERREWTSVRFTYTKADDGFILDTGEISLIVMPDGGVTFSTPDGCLLREELPPLRIGSGWIHRALLQPESSIMGLGERAAPLNLRGGSYIMWNADPMGQYGPGKDPLYLCIPVYVEMHKNGNYLVFYENGNPGYFTITETASATFQEGMLRYFFTPGPIQRALARYTDLTGRAPLPPRWALGYHQSRWGYKNEADIRSVVNGFKKHNLPISAVHLDIDHMEGYRVFTVDKANFPDLGALTADLEAQGIKVVSIVNPGVKEDRSFALYQQGIKEKYFCTEPDGKFYVGVVWPGRTLFPDFTNPKVREWWSNQYQSLLNEGVAGFWHDMNEPTSFAAWGDNRFPLPIHHEMEGQGGDHRNAHNLYGMLMNRSGFEGVQKADPAKRPWILSRSGWAGTQRYAWNWTGDVESTWESLRMVIPMVINMGLSGQPFSGSDIGGYAGNPTAELYTRWLQLAAFMPFFRTHSMKTTNHREPWVFGDPTTTIIRQFLQLRYFLLPYFYTLAWEASQTGSPLVRPIFWPDSPDKRLWTVNNEFLLGDALLVAPILEEGKTSREVLLPEGRWYDIWTGKLIQGQPKNITIHAGLDRIPLFGRGGQILPMDKGDGALTLLVFYPESSAAENQALRLYSDRGDGYAKTSQDYRIDTFSMERSGDNLTIRRTSEGSYAFPYKAIRFHLIGFIPTNAIVDGENIAVSNDGQFLTWIFNEINIR